MISRVEKRITCRTTQGIENKSFLTASEQISSIQSSQQKDAHLGVQQLHRACDAHGNVIFGHGRAGLRIVVLVHIETTIATT